MKRKHYTPEQIDYIRSVASERTSQEITDLFNKKFCENRSMRAIRNVMSRYGIRNNMQGHATRFEKGQRAWNKGMDGLQLGGEKGWFPKGNAMRSIPVGSERLEEGYIKIKIADPNVWALKHRYLWEEHNGEIPKGYVVLFKDNNRMNITIDNLFMTPHIALTSISRRKIDTEHEEIRPSLFKLAELELKIKELSIGL